MTTDAVTTLFNVRSHNPSFQAVKESRVYAGELLDFCVPVNLHFPPPAMLQMIRENLPEILRHYPDYAEVHQKHIAALTDLDPDTIVVANGSTEIITMLCQETPGTLVTSVPTFGRWTDLPIELGIPFHTIQRRREKNFRLDVGEIVTTVREAGATTLVISNPNNPTGAWLSLEEIKALAVELQHLHSIIIDESFIDFSDIESASSLAAVTHNLIVLKSMGKAIGWHGIRLGYLVATPARARSIRSRLPFWNINGLAAFVLRNMPQFRREYEESFRNVAADRAYMTKQLMGNRQLTIFPSKANFLFAELPAGVSGRKLRDHLLTRYGLMIRETSNKMGSTEKYLRLAVQRPAAVDLLCSALGVELQRARHNEDPCRLPA